MSYSQYLHKDRSHCMYMSDIFISEKSPIACLHHLHKLHVDEKIFIESNHEWHTCHVGLSLIES